MRKPSNPFILSGYHSPEYFCDRQEDLAWLMEQYENERNTVLAAVIVNMMKVNINSF